jgi:hypothetical protein
MSEEQAKEIIRLLKITANNTSKIGVDHSLELKNIKNTLAKIIDNQMSISNNISHLSKIIASDDSN